MDAGGKGSEVLDGINGKEIVSKSLIGIPLEKKKKKTSKLEQQFWCTKPGVFRFSYIID